MGFREQAAFPNCKGSRVLEPHEDRTTGILRTVTIDRLSRCQASLRACSQSHCEDAAGMSLNICTPLQMLTYRCAQDYDGQLNFTMDAWTSPNHKALVAFAVHLQHEGEPLSFLLDVVEVASSHTGNALAKAFITVLKEFGIQEKVSLYISVDLVTHLVIAACCHG